MDKGYQVFVGSTYKDLQDEPREIMQALLKMDCIPTGIGLFPAADDDSLTLIQRFISNRYGCPIWTPGGRPPSPAVIFGLRCSR
jgi:hypothetical protein